VYDRRIGDRELQFEPSGALETAALVMRDRETDSWWSIMSSKAIGGALAGTQLAELPVGEKTTWADWKARYPETRVLSVEGREHDEGNPYDAYFTDERTFGGVEIHDHRLAPKAAVYSFWYAGKPVAIPRDQIEGGRVVAIDGTRLLFHRPVGSPIYRSTEVYVLPPVGAEVDDVDTLLARIMKGEIAGVARLGGFDTFWYTWVAVNPSTGLILP
jgi:hypothetical protein